MLFDNFVDSNVIEQEDEIMSNISDILDSCNHCNDNDLPHAFGIIDTLTKGTISEVIDKTKNAIERFEPRLSAVDVSLISNTNGIITFEISGSYMQQGQRIFLRFKKAI